MSRGRFACLPCCVVCEGGLCGLGWAGFRSPRLFAGGGLPRALRALWLALASPARGWSLRALRGALWGLASAVPCFCRCRLFTRSLLFGQAGFPACSCRVVARWLLFACWFSSACRVVTVGAVALGPRLGQGWGRPCLGLRARPVWQVLVGRLGVGGSCPACCGAVRLFWGRLGAPLCSPCPPLVPLSWGVGWGGGRRCCGVLRLRLGWRPAVVAVLLLLLPARPVSPGLPPFSGPLCFLWSCWTVVLGGAPPLVGCSVLLPCSSARSFGSVLPLLLWCVGSVVAPSVGAVACFRV